MGKDLLWLVGNRLLGIIRSEQRLSLIARSKPHEAELPYTLRDLVRVSLTSVKTSVRNTVFHHSSIDIGSLGKLVTSYPSNVSFQPDSSFRHEALKGKPAPIFESLDFWNSYLHRDAKLIDSTLEDAMAASVEKRFAPSDVDHMKLASHIIGVMCEAIRVSVCLSLKATISVLGEFEHDPDLGVRYTPDPLLVNTALAGSKGSPWDPKHVEVLDTDILESEPLQPDDKADLQELVTKALKLHGLQLEEKTKEELERHLRNTYEER